MAPTIDEALARLLDGNERYTAMRQIHPHQSIVRRERLALEGQNPFAAILSCSDSRVPSELIFDQGLGDLFIVRTAGHVVYELELASIEYAVHVLQVPLVMVMGHGECGAVTAVLKAQTLPGYLPRLAARLRPAVREVPLAAGDDPATEAATIDRAIRANTLYTADYIGQTSPVLRQARAQGTLRIVPAYYDMISGRVEVLT